MQKIKKLKNKLKLKLKNTNWKLRKSENWERAKIIKKW
jgi:hypothetical protein